MAGGCCHRVRGCRTYMFLYRRLEGVCVRLHVSQKRGNGDWGGGEGWSGRGVSLSRRFDAHVNTFVNNRLLLFSCILLFSPGSRQKRYNPAHFLYRRRCSWCLRTFQQGILYTTAKFFILYFLRYWCVPDRCGFFISCGSTILLLYQFEMGVHSDEEQLSLRCIYMYWYIYTHTLFI